MKSFWNGIVFIYFDVRRWIMWCDPPQLLFTSVPFMRCMYGFNQISLIESIWKYWFNFQFLIELNHFTRVHFSFIIFFGILIIIIYSYEIESDSFKGFNIFFQSVSFPHCYLSTIISDKMRLRDDENEIECDKWQLWYHSSEQLYIFTFDFFFLLLFNNKFRFSRLSHKVKRKMLQFGTVISSTLPTTSVSTKYT